MKGYFKTLAWTNFFIAVLAEPKKLYNRIVEEKKAAIWLAIISVALVVFTEIVTAALLKQQTSFFYYKVSYGYLLLLICLVVQIFFGGALIDFTAQLHGHKGDVKILLIASGLVLFPRVLLLPVILIFKVVNFGLWFFYPFVSFLLLLWSIYLLVQVVSSLYSIDKGKAFFIIILPPAVILMIIFFSGILVLANLYGFLVSII